MTRDRIQHALNIIYEKVFNLGQADLYPGLVSGPYLQHNPLFPNGLDAIVGYIKQAGRIPCEVKRVAIDGDLAFVHVRWVPPAVPTGLPFNVAQLYMRMAEGIREGKSASPDFAVAVKRHRLLDLIQKASDTGIRQIL